MAMESIPAPGDGLWKKWSFSFNPACHRRQGQSSFIFIRRVSPLSILFHFGVESGYLWHGADVSGQGSVARGAVGQSDGGHVDIGRMRPQKSVWCLLACKSSCQDNHP